MHCMYTYVVIHAIKSGMFHYHIVVNTGQTVNSQLYFEIDSSMCISLNPTVYFLSTPPPPSLSTVKMNF